MEEENLKQIFVGSKYSKFEKKVFSIPSFFFGEIYFAYRKMIIYAVIAMLMLGLINAVAMQIQNFGLAILAILCIRTAIGLLFPLWYRKFYNSKVKNILANNADKSEQEKINIAQKSGGTSVLYLIIFLIISSTVSGYFNKINMFGAPDTSDNKSNTVVSDSSSENDKIDEDNSSENETQKDVSNTSKETSAIEDGDYKIIEDAKISGYTGFNNSYTIYVGENNEEYECTAENPSLLACAKEYEELSVTIYYTEDDGKKTIEKYELYNTETDEKIEDVESEDDIRKALGYKLKGSYEEILTLVKKDENPGGGVDGEKTYTYYDYVFKDEAGKEIEFTYKIYEDTEDKSDILEENEKYNVKYDIQDGLVSGYEYVITDIEKI